VPLPREILYAELGTVQAGVASESVAAKGPVDNSSFGNVSLIVHTQPGGNGGSREDDGRIGVIWAYQQLPFGRKFERG
jgi:hypothetical protein